MRDASNTVLQSNPMPVERGVNGRSFCDPHLSLSRAVPWDLAW